MDGVSAERRETEVFTLQHFLFDMLAKQAEQNVGSDSCHSRLMRPENYITNFKYIHILNCGENLTIPEFQNRVEWREFISSVNHFEALGPF